MLMLHERILKLEAAYSDLERKFQIPEFGLLVNGNHFCTRFVINCHAIPQDDLIEKFVKALNKTYSNAEIYPIE